MFDAPFRDAHLGLNMGLGLLKSLTMHNAHLFVKALCKSDTTGLSSCECQDIESLTNLTHKRLVIPHLLFTKLLLVEVIDLAMLAVCHLAG